MERTTKQRWLREGLQVLSQHGASGLTLDVLTKRLKVTKGSFYHHFRNRRVYTEELLSYWEEEMTQDIIRRSEEMESPRMKVNRLTELIGALKNRNLEVAIRAWALRDPLVRKFQRRVDQRRLSYCEQLCRCFTEKEEKARIWALLFYTVYVGTQQMIPALRGDEVRRLLKELELKYMD